MTVTMDIVEKKTLRAAGRGPVRVTLLGALEWLFSRFEECLFCPDIYIIDLLLSGTLRTYMSWKI